MRRMRHFPNLSMSEPSCAPLSPAQLDSVGRSILNECARNVPIGSLYKGSCGVAYVLCCLAARNKGETSCVRLADEARDIATSALPVISSKRITLLEGRPGAIYICIVSSLLLNDAASCDQYVNHLLALGERQALDLSPSECEVLYGRCGYIHALVATRRALSCLSTTHSAPPVAGAVLSALLRHVYEEGTRHPDFSASSPLLQWKWHDKVYLGACHGVAGILYTLLLCSEELREVCGDSSLQHVQLTIDNLLSRHCHPSGNLRSSVGSSRDELVQWCHGATGLVHLLILASRIYSAPAYLDHAEVACQVIWERGLLLKESGLCHGAAGNAYAMLALAKELRRLGRTSDWNLWLNRVHYFARFIAARYAPAAVALSGYDFRSANAEPNYSLFDGRAGAAALLLGLATITTSHSQPSLDLAEFPAYDFM